MIPEIINRRSIRKFKPDPVPESVIDDIITAGSLAPSAKNRQPWKFIVTSDGSKTELLDAMEEGLARERISPLLPGSASGLADAEHTLSVMKQAPILIFIMNTLGTDITEPLTADEREFEICNVLSIGVAAENMILTAQGLGIGSLWICNTCFAQRELNRLLGGELCAAIALGYPDEAPPPRPRRPLAEITERRR